MTKSDIKEEEMEVSQISIAEGGEGKSLTDKEQYKELCMRVNPIAQPLANRKQAKKLYKLIRKAHEANELVEGLSELQKALRKDKKGIVILAGDVSPIDIYSHIPGICEEKNLAYCYTPARAHLGIITGHRRATIAVMVKRNDAYGKLYDEMETTLNEMVVEEVNVKHEEDDD